MMEIDFVRSRFIKHFDGKTGNVYASPGRINLIGEHTDYNGGFVFPGAVDKGIMAEMRANGTEDTVMAYAIDLKDRAPLGLVISMASHWKCANWAFPSRALILPLQVMFPSVPACRHQLLWRAASLAV